MDYGDAGLIADLIIALSLEVQRSGPSSKATQEIRRRLQDTLHSYVAGRE